MIRASSALVLAMLVLSACASLESIKRELFPPEQAAAGDTVAASSASQPSASQPSASQPSASPSSASQPAEVPPRPRRKPEAISELTLAEADPERLVGLDFDAAKALLGAPAATHEEPPAEIWAYQGGTCSFNLFFYPSVDDKVFRVLAYEVTEENPAAEETPPSGEVPPSGDTIAEASEPGAVKVRDKDNPTVRRCFAELLHFQQVPNAG